MKQRNIDLLHGNILTALTELAVPIMATALVQTAYNLTDMAWIGVVGSEAVAAVGAAGMYTWLSSGLVTIARMGGQVKAAQSIGEGKREEAGLYAGGAIQLTIFFALMFTPWSAGDVLTIAGGVSSYHPPSGCPILAHEHTIARTAKSSHCMLL